MVVSISKVNERLILIDSLRGVAALWVMLFHFYFAVKGSASQILPEPLHTLLSIGEQGVFIFFVLSGFVISLSVKKNDLSFQYITRFFARRLVRLDIPYWIIIFLTGFSVLAMLHLNVSSIPAPTTVEYLLNMFYLDNLLQAESIVSVGWTLQYEIQFYLFYVIWLYMSLKLFGKNPFILFLVSFLLSLFSWFPWFPFHIEGFFLGYWFYFLLGVFTAWVFSGDLKDWILAVIALLVLGHYLFFDELSTLVALGTSVLLFLASKFQKFNTWLNFRWLVSIGTISYSLYLVHPFLGNRMLRFLAARHALSEMYQIALLLGVTFFAITFAYLFYRVIEFPVHRLSKRIKMK